MPSRGRFPASDSEKHKFRFVTFRASLLLQRGVPRVADDERAEDGSDSRPGSRDSDGGGAGTDELGRAVDVFARRGGLEGSALDTRGGGGPRSLW